MEVKVFAEVLVVGKFLGSGVAKGVLLVNSSNPLLVLVSEGIGEE